MLAFFFSTSAHRTEETALILHVQSNPLSHRSLSLSASASAGASGGAGGGGAGAGGWGGGRLVGCGCVFSMYKIPGVPFLDLPTWVSPKA